MEVSKSTEQKRNVFRYYSGTTILYVQMCLDAEHGLMDLSRSTNTYPPDRFYYSKGISHITDMVTLMGFRGIDVASYFAFLRAKQYKSTPCVVSGLISKSQKQHWATYGSYVEMTQIPVDTVFIPDEKSIFYPTREVKFGIVPKMFYKKYSLEDFIQCYLATESYNS